MLISVWAVCLALPVLAQVPEVLSRSAFLRLLRTGHPLVRQAELRPEMGAATVRSARGAFDPALKAGYDGKTFDDKDYFELRQAGLTIPTWWGIDVFAGLEDNDGPFVDPERITPANGLVKAGVQVPLGQGALMDQRRATLRMARAYERGTEAERQQLLNTVVLRALNDYTDWMAAYRALAVSNAALALAQQRSDAVRGSWRGGDRPAIDTLEAHLQWSDRIMRQQQAALAFRNAGLRLSDHLWDAAQRPLELGAEVVPDTADLGWPARTLDADTALLASLSAHPQVVQAEVRVERAEVEQRLRAELLKPDLDLNYQWLAQPEVIGGSAGDQGHRVGVGFSMPLLLRKERGELALAKLRTADARLALERDRLHVRNRVKERINEIATLRAQVDLGAAMVASNERLLRGEIQRFTAGESSLFLVNAREVPLLEAQLRQIDLEARLHKAWFALDHDAGTLWNTLP